MNKNEIIKILVDGFEKKLNTASDALLYSIYAEYLNQKEEEKARIQKNQLEDEVQKHKLELTQKRVKESK